jgi:hypothetical protein
MVSVTITVQVCDMNNDTYAKWVGVTVDCDLCENWWWSFAPGVYPCAPCIVEQLGPVMIADCPASTTFTIVKDLAKGDHYVEVCVSVDYASYGPYYAKIYVGKNLIAEGQVYINPFHKLRGNFSITETGTVSGGTPEAGVTTQQPYDISQLIDKMMKMMTPMMNAMIQMMMAIMMINMIMSMMSRLTTAFAPPAPAR